MNISPLGDRAILITLGSSIDDATHRLVRATVARIDAARLRGVVDLVPAFASVAVHYKPEDLDGELSPYKQLAGALQEVLADVRHAELSPARLVEIPVCYGGELGPDLEDVAARHEMTAEQVVRRHAEAEYLVYMVGFMPGFAYLGGLPDEIATPRRSSPRAAVPAGTVGIGGSQTGVYPLVSPGGWNLIGRTPLRIFDISRDEPARLATGDRVRFRPITRAEFDDWRD